MRLFFSRNFDTT